MCETPDKISRVTNHLESRSPMRRPLVAGNWKMNGNKASAFTLLSELKQGCELVETAELAVLPPAIFLPMVEDALIKTQISWGAQNLSFEQNGAFTGEISASMLLEYDCTYVLVGHSERRALYGETNEVVSKKFYCALNAGLRPILCVGETEQQREEGQTIQIIKEQLAAVTDMTDNHSQLEPMVIAYEPVWAIGTGKQATPQQTQEVHAFIRSELKRIHPTLADVVRIIYGGSVKPGNAINIFAMPDVDGGLIGGASLRADQFLEIGKICNS